MRAARFDRVAILADGSFDVEGAKTAVGIIRYGRCRTVAVIDSEHAGKPVGDVCGVGGDIPVVSSLSDALRHNPQTLVIGIAPRGGILPDAWRSTITEALKSGLDIISGLHVFLNDDPDFSRIAAGNGCIISDVRRPPVRLPVASGAAKSLPNNTILTVGTDCCVGKMSVSLELVNAARTRKLSVDFVATGQTGIMIWGRGISVDACVADFVAGATEQMVLESANAAQHIFVEGQGSLYHPGYSGVTMGLIHGSSPKKLILCHQPSRPNVRGYDIPIPSLDEVIDYHERVLNPLFPTRVAAIALNTYDLSDEEAKKAIAQAESVTGLPADDCVRYGTDKLLDAVINE